MCNTFKKLHSARPTFAADEAYLNHIYNGSQSTLNPATATKLFISLSKELQRGQTNSTMGTIVSPTIGVYSLLCSACECLWTTPAATETFTLFHNSCAALGLICLLRSLNLRQMLWIRTMGQSQGVLCCLFVNFSLLYTRTPFHFSNIKLSHTST